MRTIAAASLLATALSWGCARGAAQGPVPPVARVDGQAVTQTELDQEAKAALAQAEARHAEELHRIRSGALEGLVEKRLLEARARKVGIGVETLLVREVAARIPEPDEAYLKAVWDQTKANGKVVPPFEESKGDIARFVKSQSYQSLRQAFVARLRSEARVEILLPPPLPPKVAVSAEGPSRGDPKAPVTIVEFSDYECSFCATAEPLLARLLAEYPGKVRVVFQSFPLSIHADAPKASEAALCAGEQERYWEMHERLFADQKKLKPADLKAHARALGLDAARFDACLDSGRMAGTVQAAKSAGESAGISSTPTFFVNGRVITGVQPYERFREIVGHELAAAR